MKIKDFQKLIAIACSVTIILCFLASAILLIVYIVRNKYEYGDSTVYFQFSCHDQWKCGCPNWRSNDSLLNPRIVGGHEAPPLIYPWLVALTRPFKTEPFCAGFIIESNLIITAAHCLINTYPDRVEILSKLHDVRKFQGDRHRIDRWIIHPQYRLNDSKHLNDIALIKIDDNFDDSIQQVCLPLRKSSIYPASKSLAVVAGWGRLSPSKDSRFSPILQHVSLPIVDPHDRKCQITIADSRRQICAGFNEQPIDSCAGDSGAPLLVVETEENHGRFVAVGLVSYGNRLCDASISSGVYTRLSFYMDWLNESRTILRNDLH